MACKEDRDKYVQCLGAGAFVAGSSIAEADSCMHPGCGAVLIRAGSKCIRGHSQKAYVVIEALLDAAGQTGWPDALEHARLAWRMVQALDAPDLAVRAGEAVEELEGQGRFQMVELRDLAPELLIELGRESLIPLLEVLEERDLVFEQQLQFQIGSYKNPGDAACLGEGCFPPPPDNLDLYRRGNLLAVANHIYSLAETHPGASETAGHIYRLALHLRLQESPSSHFFGDEAAALDGLARISEDRGDEANATHLWNLAVLASQDDVQRADSYHREANNFGLGRNRARRYACAGRWKEASTLYMSIYKQILARSAFMTFPESFWDSYAEAGTRSGESPFAVAMRYMDGALTYRDRSQPEDRLRMRQLFERARTVAEDAEDWVAALVVAVERADTIRYSPGTESLAHRQVEAQEFLNREVARVWEQVSTEMRAAIEEARTGFLGRLEQRGDQIVIAMRMRAGTFVEEGDYAGAEEIFQSMRELGNILGDPNLRASAVVGLCEVQMLAGGVNEGLAFLREATELRDQVDSPNMAAILDCYLGGQALAQGDYEAARNHYLSGRKYFAANSLAAGGAVCSFGEGASALARGKYEVAQDCFERAARAMKEVRNRRGRYESTPESTNLWRRAKVHQADALLRQGEYTEAEAMVRERVLDHEILCKEDVRALARLVLAGALEGQGREDDAAQARAEWAKICREQGVGQLSSEYGQSALDNPSPIFLNVLVYTSGGDVALGSNALIVVPVQAEPVGEDAQV